MVVRLDRPLAMVERVDASTEDVTPWVEVRRRLFVASGHIGDDGVEIWHEIGGAQYPDA